MCIAKTFLLTHIKRNFLGYTTQEKAVISMFVSKRNRIIKKAVKKTVSEIKSELVVLELQGLVRKVDGGYVLM